MIVFSGFSRLKILFFLVVCVILSRPIIAVAAPANQKNAAESVTALKILLEQSRKVISSYYNQYSEIEKQKQLITNIGATLDQQKKEAEAAHTTHIQNLQQANSDKFSAETTMYVLPTIVNIHGFFLNDFAKKIRQEAGIAVSNPDPEIRRVGNESQNPFEVRPAMGQIVDTVMHALQHVREVLNDASQFLSAISKELSNIANKTSVGQELVQYGNTFYYTQLSKRLTAYQQAFTDFPRFFYEVDADGFSAPPQYPCKQSTSYIDGFNYELLEDVASTNAYAKQRTWDDEWFKKQIVPFYNGDQQRNIIGVVSHWNGCYTSKQNDIIPIKADITRAKNEKNMSLASNLTVLVDDLQSEITRLQIQADSIINRRDIQVNDITRAAQILGVDAVENKTAGAWRASVIANAANLRALFALYPDIAFTARGLLQKASAEVSGLSQITDPIELKAKLLETSAKYEAISKNGFGKLIGEIDSAILNLKTMGINMRGGSNFLSSSIDSYTNVTRVKFQSMQDEANVIAPARLEDAKLRITTYSTNVANAGLFVADVAKKIDAFKALNAETTSLLQILNKVVSVRRYNSLYVGLVNNALSRVGGKKYPESLKGKVSTDIRTFQGGFEALITTDNQTVTDSSKVCSKRGKRTVCKAWKAKSPAGKALQSVVNQMRAALAVEIDVASLQYLDNRTVSQLVSQVTSNFQYIQSLKP